MNGKILGITLLVVSVILLGKPAVAQVQASVKTAEDTEYNQDMAALTQLTIGDKHAIRPNLRATLRHIERQWPQLLLRYAQPVVRGLLADQQTRPGFSLKTTFLRNENRGMQLVGGLGRANSGEREARMNFTLAF